jgi:hypothetical protein
MGWWRGFRMKLTNGTVPLSHSAVQGIYNSYGPCSTVHEILIEIEIDYKILQRNEQEIEIEIDKERARPFLWTMFHCA